jgi:hypothetical protein
LGGLGREDHLRRLPPAGGAAVLIGGPARVYVSCGLHVADGLMLTDDDEVVPMMDLGMAKSFTVTSVDEPDQDACE